MWQRYLHLLSKYPYRSRMATTGILFSVGDVMAQTIERRSVEDKDDGTAAPSHDFVRTARMAAWGGLIYGPFAHMWYTIIDARIPGTAFRAVAAKMALDATFVGPTVNVTLMAYTVLMTGGSLMNVREKWAADLPKMLQIMWCVFVPVNLFNFNFVPPHLRVPYINCVMLCWSTFQSYINAAGKVKTDNLKVLA